ncbi:MAG: hypothetical protein NT169_06130 [Chloroflexi bacterium]|nr:hypothetical protein [Chloroflexota bacterium]
MNVSETVERMLSGVRRRPECFDLAQDRGLGEGMLIEKWLLTEMLVQLVRLRDERALQAVEGEHKFPIKKTSRFEHCDLWWRSDGIEYWLEVKTVVLDRWGIPRGFEEVQGDYEKRNRLRAIDRFHQLVLTFPVSDDDSAKWQSKWQNAAGKTGQTIEHFWFDLLWPKAGVLSILLSSSVE